jgi:hypothetical protein
MTIAAGWATMGFEIPVATIAPRQGSSTCSTSPDLNEVPLAVACRVGSPLLK